MREFKLKKDIVIPEGTILTEMSEEGGYYDACTGHVEVEGNTTLTIIINNNSDDLETVKP